jgi:HAD superfamily hydrolase (TIGR01450 family)
MIRLVIFDIDGTVLLGDKLAPGAKEMIAFVRKLGIKVAWFTNDAVASRRERVEELGSHGIDVGVDDMFTAAFLSGVYLSEKGLKKVLLISSECRCLEDLACIEITRQLPNAILIGHVSKPPTDQEFELMEKALRNGCPLYVMQKNRFCVSRERTTDVGFFVAGIEFCLGTRSSVIGKPSPFGFRRICRKFEVKASEAIMIGDSLLIDVLPSKRAGLASLWCSQHSSWQTRGVETQEVRLSFKDIRSWLRTQILTS